MAANTQELGQHPGSKAISPTFSSVTYNSFSTRQGRYHAHLTDDIQEGLPWVTEQGCT